MRKEQKKPTGVKWTKLSCLMAGWISHNVVVGITYIHCNQRLFSHNHLSLVQCTPHDYHPYTLHSFQCSWVLHHRRAGNPAIHHKLVLAWYMHHLHTRIRHHYILFFKNIVICNLFICSSRVLMKQWCFFGHFNKESDSFGKNYYCCKRYSVFRISPYNSPTCLESQNHLSIRNSFI